MISANDIREALLDEIVATKRTDDLIKQALSEGVLTVEGDEGIAKLCGLAATAVRNRRDRDEPPVPKGLAKAWSVRRKSVPEPESEAAHHAAKFNPAPTTVVTISKLKRHEDKAWAALWIAALEEAGSRLDEETLDKLRRGDTP